MTFVLGHCASRSGPHPSEHLIAMAGVFKHSLHRHVRAGRSYAWRRPKVGSLVGLLMERYVCGCTASGSFAVIHPLKKILETHFPPNHRPHFFNLFCLSHINTSSIAQV